MATEIRRLMNLTEGKATNVPPPILYHVAGSEYEPGDRLESLYHRLGNEAYDEFDRRWPESGGLGHYHAHLVFFYDELAKARDHAEQFGGTVCRVDTSRVDDLHFNKMEPPGFWTAPGPIPPAAITLVEAAQMPAVRDKLLTA